MPDFERTKSFQKKFYGVVLDETDLKRFGEILKNHLPNTDVTLSIVIITGDSEETIRTEDANFFLTSDMPQQISSVTMYRNKPYLSQECILRLQAIPFGNASFEITSKDINSAIGLSHELERVFQQHIKKSRLVKILQEDFLLRYLCYILFSGLFTYAFFLGFGSFVHLNINTPVRLDLSDPTFLLTVYLTIMSILLGFILGFVFMTQVQKLFPIMSFSGKLTDPRASSRSNILWIIFVIIVPIVLNIIANHLS